jgi:hypothetical protein
MNRLRRPAIEVNLTEHCNLACVACDHASPLLPKKLADPDVIAADLGALAPVLHVDEVRLVGGEPLLHPELERIVALVRASGVSQQICLVSNGVLLDRGSKALWSAIDRLWVSRYPGVKVGLERPELEALARRHGFELRLDPVKSFRQTLLNSEITDPTLVERIHAECNLTHRWSCHAVYEGRYYRCSPGPFLRQRLERAGVQLALGAEDEDGVSLHGRRDLRAALEAYLAADRPLAACAWCLGTSGRAEPHRQLSAAERSEALAGRHPEPVGLLAPTGLTRVMQRVLRHLLGRR